MSLMITRGSWLPLHWNPHNWGVEGGRRARYYFFWLQKDT